MKREDYLKVMDWVEGRIGLRQIRLLVKLLTAFTFFCYGGEICYLFWMQDQHLLRVILVPAVSFGIVSGFRSWFSAKRPYQIYDFQPLLQKETQGKSFPSRHVFSIYIIGMAVFTVHPPTGIILFLAGGGLAVIRVATGVHFPRDVVAGAFTGILLGLIGFYLL